MAEKRNTLQKEIIYQTLCRLGTHPTAAMVYDAVHQDHPTISRSTVYRVLGQMAEEGAILRLGLAGSDDRFDGTIYQHGHVRCSRCGAVADIPAVEIAEPSDDAGYVLEGYAVEYRGVCPVCQKELYREST